MKLILNQVALEPIIVDPELDVFVSDIPEGFDIDLGEVDDVDTSILSFLRTYGKPVMSDEDFEDVDEDELDSMIDDVDDSVPADPVSVHPVSVDPVPVDPVPVDPVPTDGD